MYWVGTMPVIHKFMLFESNVDKFYQNGSPWRVYRKFSTTQDYLELGRNIYDYIFIVKSNKLPGFPLKIECDGKNSQSLC